MYRGIHIVLLTVVQRLHSVLHASKRRVLLQHFTYILQPSCNVFSINMPAQKVVIFMFPLNMLRRANSRTVLKHVNILSMFNGRKGMDGSPYGMRSYLYIII